MTEMTEEKREIIKNLWLVYGKDECSLEFIMNEDEDYADELYEGICAVGILTDILGEDIDQDIFYKLFHYYGDLQREEEGEYGSD